MTNPIQNRTEHSRGHCLVLTGAASHHICEAPLLCCTHAHLDIHCNAHILYGLKYPLTL